MPPRGRRNNNRPLVPFAYKLVLNQWLFSLFGLSSDDGFYPMNGRRVPLLEAFTQRFQIGENTAEGLDENNIHRFHTALVNQVEPLEALPNDLLLEYDQNIVRHTQRLNERRLARGEEPIVWKYFQYLTLLFTEIYLDRYFRDPAPCWHRSTDRSRGYNADKPDPDKVPCSTARAMRRRNSISLPLERDRLGQDPLMHANILQYQRYVEKHGRSRHLNRIILLTPNEGLSIQHLGEFQAAGFQAELFDKDGRGLLRAAQSRSST